MKAQNENRALKPHLSPAAAWALAVGTSVGWGSLVVTSNTYLNQAGPLGSVGGLGLGMVLMLLICRNFSYMAGRYPNAGGIYAYTREVFGYDRAFLVFWFLSLTYVAMFWANATSLPLFARYFIGDVFKFGRLFSLFGYEVYLGESLLTIAAILGVTALCIKSRAAAARLMVALTGIFVLGIAACFCAALLGRGASFEPGFIPDSGAMQQVLRIAFISPWAFIGFENITHSAEEFRFRQDRLHRILVISVVTSTLLYIFVTLLSVTAWPEDCDGWLDYIRRLGSYQGIEGLPAFYAAHRYMGDAGVFVLMASLLSLILTSLIGNLRALSRLFFAVARDDILPRRFARLNDRQIPAHAMLLTAAFSLPVAFVGRTAIGWIVDVTTLGATMLYGFISAAAYKIARKEGARREKLTGAIGFAIMLVFGAYLLFPNLFGDSTLETETYILFMVWTVAGFFYFRSVIAKDHARRFGRAIIVWISLLALVVIMAMIWSGRVDQNTTDSAIRAIQDYYSGAADPSVLAMDESRFIAGQVEQIHRTNTINTLVVTGLFVLALAAMLINHLSMQKWESKALAERDAARTAAYRDSLTGTKSKLAYVETEDRMDLMIKDGHTAPFAVVVADVNGLKHINDTQGHAAGDAYIQAAGRMICEQFKHSPVFRIGGDEFTIVLQGRDYEARDDILSDINGLIEANLKTGGVVISLGLSKYRPGEDLSFHTVFQRADERMYQRKQQLKAKGAITRD